MNIYLKSLSLKLTKINQETEIHNNTDQIMNAVRKKEIHLANISLIIVLGKFFIFEKETLIQGKRKKNYTWRLFDNLNLNFKIV